MEQKERGGGGMRMMGMRKDGDENGDERRTRECEREKAGESQTGWSDWGVVVLDLDWVRKGLEGFLCLARCLLFSMGCAKLGVGIGPTPPFPSSALHCNTAPPSPVEKSEGKVRRKRKTKK